MTRSPKRKEDLRIRRTRKLVQDALMTLTVESGFDAVTVTDICERAMINRTTFYRHYEDKFDLLSKYMEDLYQMLDEPQAEIQSPDPSVPPPGLVRMLEHLQGHADFYRAMLGPNGHPLFADKIRAYIEQRIGRSLPPDLTSLRPDHPPLEMLLRSVSYAGFGAVLWWLQEDMPVGPEQIATWAVKGTEAYFAAALR